MGTFINGKNKSTKSTVENPFPVELNTLGAEISDSNSLPVKNVDSAERQAHNTVFGDRIVGQRVPTLSSQFYYPLASDRSTTNFENGGSINNDDSQLRLTTAAQANSLAEVQGTFFLRYIPGHEAYCFFTCVFDTPSVNSYQRIGMFDSSNGFYVGYEGTDFVFVKIRNGVSDIKIIDPSDLPVFSNGTFNPQLGNIYKISFGYLGFATVHLEVMTPEGNWVVLSEFKYPNTSTETHIASTYLPVRAELFNGVDAQAMELSSGSITTGIVDGAGTDPGARRFTQTLPATAITAGNFEVITFRNKTTFAGLENRVEAQLLLLSIATDISRISSWNIFVNSDFTNTPTWNDVNTADSVMEYSNDANINVLTGTSQLGFGLSKVDKIFEDVEDFLVKLKPGEHATFVINTPVGTTGDVNLSVRWKELF